MLSPIGIDVALITRRAIRGAGPTDPAPPPRPPTVPRLRRFPG